MTSLHRSRSLGYLLIVLLLAVQVTAVAMPSDQPENRAAQYADVITVQEASSSAGFRWVVGQQLLAAEFSENPWLIPDQTDPAAGAISGLVPPRSLLLPGRILITPYVSSSY